VLIKAVQRLKRNDLEVVIAGSAGFDPRAPLSDYEQRLRKLAAGSAIPVRFMPFVPRTAVAGILASADIVVVPSRWPDPCPLTVLEGMASGAAVIASDIGGIPEIVGGAAILTRPGDVADLAEAIDSLAADSARLAATKSVSLERARERDWRVVAAEFRRVLARAQ
jgi:glycosyltransferase involved in cell wall biosynthesis